jgi:hypothetical protein
MRASLRYLYISSALLVLALGCRAGSKDRSDPAPKPTATRGGGAAGAPDMAASRTIRSAMRRHDRIPRDLSP